MKENDKDKIKKGLEQPSSDFSKNIMQKIDAEEVAMKSVLSRHSLDSPSTSFTDSIMSRIEVGKITPYKPVISKYAWYGMAAMFIGVIAFIFANTTITGQSKLSTRLGSVAESLSTLFTKIPYLSYSVMAVLGISLLLLLDQKLRRQSTS